MGSSFLNLIDIITVQKPSSMWKLAALFIFFLGINSILECSANDDPAVDEGEDELKAVRRRLDEVQAVCAGGPIPDESPVDDDVGDDVEDDDVEESAEEESAEDN